MCRAEQPRGVAVTTGIAGQCGKALQGVGNPYIRLHAGGVRERLVGVAFGQPWLTLGDLDAGPRGQRHHVPPARGRGDGVIGPAMGREQLPARKRGLRTEGAQRQHHTQPTHVRPGRLVRVLRRFEIAGG